MSVFLGLVVIAFLAWRLIDIGWRGWMGLRVVLGAKNRRSIDVSAWNLPPPARARENISSLAAIGFTRLGEAQVQLPGRKAANLWVLVDSDRAVQAEVAYGMVSFSTYFQDDVLAVTDYPSGEHIEQARYQSHKISVSVEKAYQHHLRQVAKFRARYGDPHAIQRMADYLRWETIGRTHYGSVKLKRFLWVHLLNVGVFFAGALIVLAVPLLVRTLNPPVSPAAVYAQQDSIELLIIGLLFPLAFVPGIFHRWMNMQTHGDSPG